MGCRRSLVRTERLQRSDDYEFVNWILTQFVTIPYSHGLWKAKKDKHDINNAFVIEFCPKSCNVCDIKLDKRDLSLNLGIPQTAPDIADKQIFNRIKAKVEDTRDYVNTLEPNLQEVCKMGHENCARFALSTECDDEAGHDIIKYLCAASCQTCELFDTNDVKKAKALYSQAMLDYKKKDSASQKTA
jgi:hypothetical protein